MVRAVDPLRTVGQIDYEWIELRDGVRLAARIWLPDDAAADPVPGILEAVPYRLSDGMATRDVLIHPWWAARGYACVRVDRILRGGGQGRFRIVTLGQMTCDATTFFVENEVCVTEGEDGEEREVFAKTWRHEAPRDFV